MHSLRAVLSGFIILKMKMTLQKTAARGGTRVPCEIPITLTSLDPVHPFSESCQIVLVNLRGCAASLRRSVMVGVAVRLQGLPVRTNVTARVISCIALGEHERLWLLSLALDEPGNVWGVQVPPADWVQESV